MKSKPNEIQKKNEKIDGTSLILTCNRLITNLSTNYKKIQKYIDEDNKEAVLKKISLAETSFPKIMRLMQLYKNGHRQPVIQLQEVSEQNSPQIVPYKTSPSTSSIATYKKAPDQIPRANQKLVSQPEIELIQLDGLNQPIMLRKVPQPDLIELDEMNEEHKNSSFGTAFFLQDMQDPFGL